MRVIDLGKEKLDIELSDAAYRICGAVGGSAGFSAFAEEIYKIVEEYPMPMEERSRYADFLRIFRLFQGINLFQILEIPTSLILRIWLT